MSGITRSSRFPRWAALVLAFIAGGVAVLVATRGAHRPSSAPPAVAPTTAWYCPMHPDFVSDVPGDCTACSMRLVPRMEGPGSVPATRAAAGSILIPAQRQQQIGVKFTEVRRVPAKVMRRLPARIAADERRIGHVHSRVTGFIEDVFVNYTGAPVTHGQPLFTIYSPEILATQRELLTALTSAQRLREGPLGAAADDADALVEAARRRLRLWGMTQGQIDRVERTREPIRAITIASPVSGIVTEREAFHHGRAVTPELDLYMIVDLSSVWVLAQVPEADLADVRVGQPALVELPWGRTFDASVSFVSPGIDPVTRSATLRIDVPNPALELKTDMLASVVLGDDLGMQLVVPPDAVLDAGDAQHAFVDLGDGYLEPRRISAGPLTDQGRVVLAGLAEGERVVSSAAFLVDAEASIRGALDTMGSPSTAPDTRVAPLDVHVETDPSPPRTGRNHVRVTVRDREGPVSDASVRVRLYMPPMGTMAPMESVAELASRGDGLYEGDVEVPMPFAWDTTVTVEKDGETLGEAHLVLSSR